MVETINCQVQARVRNSNALDLAQGVIDLNHGSGGRSMQKLIEELFWPEFKNEYLAQKNDQAAFRVNSGRMVMTTDAHVISPLFFPGGDIGSLAINGTINDIAMAGAQPLHLSASFILEEGFPLRDLQKIVHSMAVSAQQAKVNIIAGDTKVVERGKGDGVFITTTGIGIIPVGINISGEQARPGDRIIVSGYIGDHGIAVMSQRNNLEFTTKIVSDSCALHELVAAMLEVVPKIHCLRDPTRGGLATTLNELARQSQVGMLIQETALPIRTAVLSASEILGLDPLYIANEGKLVAICAAADAQNLLTAMHAHPLGRDAAIIGTVIDDQRHLVQLETKFAGSRIIDCLNGEQLPRIC